MPRRPRFRIVLALLLGATALAPAALAAAPVLRQVLNAGPSAHRVNIVVLGDGYLAADQEKFFDHASKRIDAVVHNEAFAPFQGLLNGYAVFTASNESGTDMPDQGITRDTYYDTTFSGDRLLYIATSVGNSRAQTVLQSSVPEYDIAIVLVNTTRYGGSGGSLAVASLDPRSDEILLHEMGHSFAQLTDEYVDAALGNFSTDQEFINSSQKPNRVLLPWASFVLDATPIPTIDASADPDYVGAWEGSYYHATGFYRPTYNSKMRSLGRPFGPVNVRAFADAVHRLNINQAQAKPTIGAQPLGQNVVPGGTLRLSAIAQGTGPFTYQWIRGGKFMSGQTQSTLTLSGASAADAGTYTVAITNAVGTATSSAAVVTVEARAAASSHLVNIATRAYCAVGNNVTIGGFVISGSAAKRVLVRAVGPSLTAQGIAQSEVLLDPMVEVHRGAPIIASNDNWSDNPNATEIADVARQFGATPLQSGDATSSALLLTLNPDAYTFVVTGKAGTSGIVLLEVYDADSTTTGSSFVNIATRAYATTGNGVTIGGFVISGNTSKQVLLRAVGPTLGTLGIGASEVLLDPQIELHKDAPTIATNDNWGDNANAAAILTTGARIGATPLDKADTKSSALLLLLPPGVYTFVASSRTNSPGIVLVEVYDAD